MKKQIFIISVIAACSIGLLVADKTGPGGDYTGAPFLNGNPGNTCSVSGCHDDGTDNGGAISLKVTQKGQTTPIIQYQSWHTYTVTVTVSGTSSTKYGFSATILDPSRAKNGTTNGAASGSKIVTFSSRSIAMHNTPSSTGIFTFDWTPPNSSPKDSVIIYAAGNASNGDNSKTGDQIVKTKKTLYLNKLTAGSDGHASNQFRMYPNPVVDVLYFTQPIGHAEVINLTGTVVLKAENAGSINMKDLQTGIYFVKVNGGVTKVVKI